MENESEQLYKEIDLIQDCIKRMAKNSFMIKGWTLTVFAGIIAIATENLLNNVWLLICCVLVPILSFWFLDAFYLQIEKKYRKMYEWVLEERKLGNMEHQFDLNPAKFDKSVKSIVCTFFSITLVVFYCIPLIATLVLIIQLY